jgi:hypothetical protein
MRFFLSAKRQTTWGQIDELSEDEFPSSSKELGDLLTLAIGQTDPLPPSEGSVQWAYFSHLWQFIISAFREWQLTAVYPRARKLTAASALVLVSISGCTSTTNTTTSSATPTASAAVGGRL